MRETFSSKSPCRLCLSLKIIEGDCGFCGPSLDVGCRNSSVFPKRGTCASLFLIELQSEDIFGELLSQDLRRAECLPKTRNQHLKLSTVILKPRSWPEMLVRHVKLHQHRKYLNKTKHILQYIYNIWRKISYVFCISVLKVIILKDIYSLY